MKGILKRSGPWLLLLFLTDGMFIFVIWLLEKERMGYLSFFIFLFTGMISVVGLGMEYRRQKREEEAWEHFFDKPDKKTQEVLLKKWGNSEGIRELCTQFFRQSERANEKTVELDSYREYIEEWVHEVKTPLSLHTLVLNNHQDEMSPYVYGRMTYIGHQMNEDVERILFYARLQTDHMDYKFTQFSLEECIMEVLDEYQMAVEEKKIELSLDLKPVQVISDRKVVAFMLSQLISNATKYADEQEGRVTISVWGTSDKVYFRIWNNGDGVAAEDVPFIFDKGFTGNRPNRRKATGMGLYLVRKYAEKLCVELQTDIGRDGFGIEMVFML